MPGILDFYLGRLAAARQYSPYCAHDILDMVIHCVDYDRNDGMLTDTEYRLIMKAADDLLYDILTRGAK